MELSATARVILGMLATEPRSGYDIKAISDKSARFFWAASYGQIYPELRRLADAGLIEAADPEGERRRTAYRLTDAGRMELRAWITEPGMTHELRDEGLLKLFFAGALGRGEAMSVLREKRAAHEATLAELREIEPYAASAPRFGPHAVLSYGLALHEFAVRWCTDTLTRLEQES